MINDDLNRNDLNRDSLGPGDRRTGTGRGLMGLVVAAAIIAVLFMWAPWNGPRVANAPGSTVGSSTRPIPPAPDIPAAPTATR